MIVSASLTERCNLSCRYCYAPKENGADMALETAFRIVDYAISATPDGEPLELGFFGGEPFLCLDLMQQVAARARDRARSAGVPLDLRITTNGTLLDDAALRFLESQSVNLCVSIDGPPAVHDRHRPFDDGTGSSATVIANLRRALERLDRVQVNAVYGSDTLGELPETVDFLVELGVRLIHLNLDIMSPWSAESYARLRDVYSRVADRFVACYRAGQPVAVNLIDNKVILFLKGGYDARDRCGMGKKKIGFATNGDMYPCERLIGHGGASGLCIGNVRSGFDAARLASVLERTGGRNMECAKCPVGSYCINWCGCTNYHMTGRTDFAAPLLCASEKAAIAAAESALSRLADQDLFIDHMMAYVNEDHHLRKGENHEEDGRNDHGRRAAARAT